MKTILKVSAAAAALLVFSSGVAEANVCTLNGTSGDDTLTATLLCFEWVIMGFAGDDTLTGGPGNDRLWTGSQSIFHSGHDVMTGNGGADSFFFEDTASSLGSNANEVTDFAHGTDDLNVYPVCHAQSVTCNYIGGASFSGTAGEVRYAVGGGSTVGIIEIDLDGDTTSDYDIALDGAPTVSSNDVQIALPPRRVHPASGAK
jgi:hypothetical protein